MPRNSRQRPPSRRRSNDGNPRKKKVKRNVQEDEFFEAASGDEELISSDDDHDNVRGGGEEEEVQGEGQAEDNETADEKRLRVAKAYLEKIRASTKALHDDGDEEQEREAEAAGNRDSLVADLLQQAQLEESGRALRKLAARVVEPTVPSQGRNVSRRHRQAVTAIALSEDDARGFAASKDGLVVHWDVEKGSSEKYLWPDEVNKPKGTHKDQKRKGSRCVLALAVSSDGRYLATGGLDRNIHLWDTRTREHIQVFPGHRGAVSSLVFRQGAQQLMSASFDRTIKLWSVEDRSYMDTLYGHQSEVLTIDCLRQERVLSAGRDRTLRLWKIPDETQLVFRGHAASMECCCFVTNNEFLSGSDDGSVALWNIMKKKPATLIRNAHGVRRMQKAGNSTNKSNIQVDQKSIASENDISRTAKFDDPAPVCVGVESWVGAMAVCRGSDLAASGAGDGFVRLWAFDEENRSLHALHSLPVKGFVNSLAISKSARFLLAGVGQEPRLGRWGRISHARNGVILHSLIPDE